MMMKKFNYSLLLAIISIGLISCSEDDSVTPNIIDSGQIGESSYRISELGENHHSIYTEIVIEASASEVWSVLTDWDNYTLGDGEGWSTTFLGLELIEGNAIEDGAIVDAYLFFEGFGNGPYRHTLIYRDGIEFGWSDPVAGSDQITDNHIYRVEEISATQTRFIQTDEYMGVDANGFFTTETLALNGIFHFNTFNNELKAEVER
ncbi:MAG: hypothetical protein R8G66_11535 [Cytophagales bacterium]|nr:hypothetical protein [Cytophagales bacterium]